MTAWLRLLCACLLACAAAPAAAQPWAATGETALRLDDGAARHDAWPAVRVLADEAGALDWRAALAARERFEVPQAPHANLGVRRGAVWLLVPLEMPPARDGRWMLDIDYPSLDRVDVHVVHDGRLLQQARLGDLQPFDRRVLPTRSHAVELALPAGMRSLLLLRVETTSTAIVPVELARPQAFYAREARLQMLQGLMAGLGACLLLYCLVHGRRQRETLFVHYAITVSGTTLFFMAYAGLGPQHLWPHSEWLTRNAAPLTVLVALAGAFHFMRHALDAGADAPVLARAMQAGGWVATATGAAFAAGLVDYRVAHLVSTVLGPLPMVFGLPLAWRRLREGDRSAGYLLIGWGGYGVAVVLMAGLLRGWVPSSFWTQHAFQFGSMFEMVMWQLVLAQRAENLRLVALRARSERDAFQAMAHTDPLTGLYNRRGLMVEVQARLAACGEGRQLALYLIDLDGFKAVNDTLGHDAGDALLLAVGQRLSTALRADDVVARLGGDEFVVVADPMLGDAEARRLGRKLLAAFDAPFEIAGQPCRIGLTIGFALAPQDGLDAEGLLRRADAAMYEGKRGGKHQLRRLEEEATA